MNFNFGYVLQQPLRLLWKHKRLLLLNLPNSLMAGAGMLLFPLMVTLPILAETRQFEQAVADPLPILAGFFIFSILVFLIITPISILTNAALIEGVTALESGQEMQSLRDLLRRARLSFWRLASLMGLQSLVGFFFAMLPGLLIVFTAGAAVICLGPLMPLLTPVMFIFSLVGILALHVVIVEKMPMIEAIKLAWAQFKKAWLYLLGVFLLVFQVGGMAIGFIFFIPMLAVVPFAIALTNSDPQTAALPMGIGILALLILLPLAVFAFLIYGSYTQTALALTYLEIHKSTPSLLPQYDTSSTAS